mmetsp:Transcript_78696/g.228416  ORF Transcript_78696/g.228416 Transcript_78696/m.228416 type:complete len:301 (+) Transcript_78696:282-1184(+)
MFSSRNAMFISRSSCNSPEELPSEYRRFCGATFAPSDREEYAGGGGAAPMPKLRLPPRRAEATQRPLAARWRDNGGDVAPKRVRTVQSPAASIDGDDATLPSNVGPADRAEFGAEERAALEVHVRGEDRGDPRVGVDPAEPNSCAKSPASPASWPRIRSMASPASVGNDGTASMLHRPEEMSCIIACISSALVNCVARSSAALCRNDVANSVDRAASFCTWLCNESTCACNTAKCCCVACPRRSRASMSSKRRSMHPTRPPKSPECTSNWASTASMRARRSAVGGSLIALAPRKRGQTEF